MERVTAKQSEGERNFCKNCNDRSVVQWAFYRVAKWKQNNTRANQKSVNYFWYDEQWTKCDRFRSIFLFEWVVMCCTCVTIIIAEVNKKLEWNDYRWLFFRFLLLLSSPTTHVESWTMTNHKHLRRKWLLTNAIRQPDEKWWKKMFRLGFQSVFRPTVLSLPLSFRLKIKMSSDDELKISPTYIHPFSLRLHSQIHDERKQKNSLTDEKTLENPKYKSLHHSPCSLHRYKTYSFSIACHTYAFSKQVKWREHAEQFFSVAQRTRIYERKKINYGTLSFSHLLLRSSATIFV